MSAVSYTPAPYEQAYYEGLFQAADVRRANSLGGGEAVAFFSRSKLPTDVLKNVWTLSDQNPTSNSLDRKKFATAVRLIQLSQNGQKAQGTNLAAPPGVNLRPVFFEGVSGVSVPMPQPPQQMQQPPQQQMQQPPPSPQHQHPPRPPMQQSGMMSGPPMQQPAMMSMALVPQDPYSLPPQEQARYEDLFAQYAKEDGFVYGPEAVALFSKSGLSSNHLRDIWNMVDAPVDNRLDKLEFAIAMHLIVCVSKKNMPMPQGLPISLKVLKSQQQQPPPPPTQTMRATSPQMAPQMGGGAAAVGSFGAPQMGGGAAAVGSFGAPQMGAVAVGSFGAPQSTMSSVGNSPQMVPQMAPQMMGSNWSVGSGSGPPQMHSAPPPEIHAPPPLQKLGISDAFEGLDGPGMGMMGPGMMGRGMTGFQHLAGGIPDPGSVASAHSFEQPQVETIPEPTPAPAPMAREKPKTTKELASSYDMGDNAMELDKLKTLLQKLQAENISLKASLGSMTQEEKEVQKEISATVHEIGILSSQLTTLRAQVLAAKSALLEATAELKGHKEKKAMITDLISETQATKNAINSALNGVHEAEHMVEESQAPANMPPPSYEADLFSWDSPPKAALVQSEPEPAPKGVSAPASTAVPEVTTASTDEDDVAHDYGHGAPAAFHPAPVSYGQVMTVTSSDGEDGVMGGAGQKSPLPFSGDSPPTMAHKAFGGDAAALASSPTAAEVERLKESARLAEQAAKEAEDNRRGLAQQADDLRLIADQAEEEVREHEAALSKKKGGLGRKRKELRELEKLKQEVAEKQRQFMDVQKKANDAQVLALETRREADKLHQQAEQTEIEAVQAVSMQESQPAQFQTPVQYAAPAPAPVNGGTHEKTPSYGGFGGDGGFGGGFGIMGGAAGDTGGDWHIPSPTGSENGDAHPFR